MCIHFLASPGVQNKTQRAEDVLIHFADEGQIALPSQGFQHNRHGCHFPHVVSLAGLHNLAAQVRQIREVTDLLVSMQKTATGNI